MSYQFVIIHNNAPIYNCCFTYTWVNIRVYIIHLFNQHATDVKIRLSKYSSQIQSTNGPEIQVEENIHLTRALVLGGSNYCSTCYGFLIRKKIDAYDQLKIQLKTLNTPTKTFILNHFL